jgi:glycine C-acetyltransferase
MPFDSQIAEALRALEAAGLRRRPRQIKGAQGPEIEIDGRRVVCLCSNNYLGLANHPAIVHAAVRAAQEEGVGSGASRLITGTMDAHGEAEAAFSEFAGAPAAVLFSTGYAANLGAIQALVGEGDAVFSDALNHASLIDGCRLSRARTYVYRHRDPGHLEELLKAHRAKVHRALIATDSLFSMDGVTAPVQALQGLARSFDSGLLVDEAHALGVLGPMGRGVCAELGVAPDLVVGTLGKSFGTAGAFVAGAEPLIDFIRNRARSYVYSTAPSPVLVRAALAALPLVRDADDRRTQLLSHAARLGSALRGLGFDVPDTRSQILPVFVGENDRTMQLSLELFERGVFVQGIRPPTVPVGTARLRLTPMATHRTEHIERAIGAFAASAPKREESRT